jgi:uncharacterized membrane protein
MPGTLALARGHHRSLDRLRFVECLGSPVGRGGLGSVSVMLGVTELKIGDWAIARDISEWIEIVAIAVIATSVVIAIVLAVRSAVKASAKAAQEVFKHEIARGLLIGLDLLIAADIIRTVTLEPTLENVAALGLLVVVRTFLAWSLQLEAEGRWPWQTKPTAHPTEPPPITPHGGRDA